MPGQHLHRRPLSPEWWLLDRDGRRVIVQWPNPALMVWFVAELVTWVGIYPHREGALADVGRGALVVWAIEELLHGANPFRRLLGLTVFVVQIVGFLS